MVPNIENLSLGENLSASQKEEIVESLSKFPQAFAQNPKKPGRADWVEHSIEPNSTNPVKQKNRRTPVIWEKKVDNQIEEMLENDIIRPSKSPWSSQILSICRLQRSE